MTKDYKPITIRRAQPADAADALAIALCHAWRRGAPGRSAGGELTPAQRAWADAERVARTYVRRTP